MPEGWAWCRLKDLFNVCSSKRVLQSEWRKEGIPFYRAREIVKLSNNGFVDNDLFISLEHYEALKKSYGVPQAGDLMVTGVGTIGKVYIVQENDTFYYKDASVLCFENLYGAIVSEYARIMIDSSLLKEQIHSKTYGNTVDTITISTANEYLCVLPPMNEQYKIIETVKSVLEVTDIIENCYKELKTCIVQAKSKILDLAIRGKLVPQNPDDEPASVLLERIRAEKEELIKQGKIKRDKKESVIFKGEDNSYYEKLFNGTAKCIDDEIPCVLPQGWEWCRLNTLSDACINSFVDGPFGSNLKTEHYTQNREVRIIQLNNIGEFVWRDIGVKYTTFKHAETLDRCITYPEDIVIAKMMPAGRAIIVPQVESIYVISSDCVRLRTHKQIYNRYLMFAINSNIVNKQIQESVHGIGRSRTSLSKCKELLIPIPPLKEQVCIEFKIIYIVFVHISRYRTDSITMSCICGSNSA